ncbi:MAG: PDZ domain-containing protein [Deltaproteobacteria bacterium]|nr:PDZ domain-containing protein [Deltaproteobacteria bacterium]
MKKLIVIILCTLFIGCATLQQKPKNPPPVTKQGTNQPVPGPATIVTNRIINRRTGRRSKQYDYQEYKSQREGGVLVVSVIPGSAADQAGLEKGDVIFNIDGHKHLGLQSFLNYIKISRAGTHLIMVERNGIKKRLLVHLPSFSVVPRLGVMLSSLRPGAVTTGGGKGQTSNADLFYATRKVNYSPPDSLGRRLKEINVLKYIFVDPQTNKVIFVGTYDSRYPSGPIPYYDLLADALNDPYPEFSLDLESSLSSIRKIKDFMNPEMQRISNDVEYGKKWMVNMGMSILNSNDSMPEKAVVLKRMKQEMGIEPEEFEEYLKFDPHARLITNQAYERMENFLGKLLAKVGVEERFGKAFIVFSRMQKEFREGSISNWTQQRLYRLLNVQKEIFTIRDDMDARRITAETAARRMFALYYSALLKGFGAPAEKVDALADRYRQGYSYDEKLAEMLEGRYEFLAKKALQKYVFQSFVFSQEFLHKVYKQLPLATCGVKLYGRKPDSPLARIMFNADYALKYISALSPEALSVPGHEFASEFLTREAERQGVLLPDEGLQRAWIKPGNVDLKVLDNNGSVYFAKADLSIGFEPLGSNRNSAFMKKALNLYADRLTHNYDNYARIYPSLHVMREAEKIIAFARWIKNNKIEADVPQYHPFNNPVPKEVIGFVTVSYVSKKSGETDNMFLDVEAE